MKKFKTHSLTFRNRIAILQWDSKELKVMVLWATMTEKGLDILGDWPAKNTPARNAFEKLLSDVREYCSDRDLRLWSY